MSTLARTVEILEKLIAFPTISPDSNLEMIAFMADHLGQLGARVNTFTSPCGTKANLFATLGPEGDGGIVLSGHSDVVPVAEQDWTSDPFTLAQRDGLLFGRGTCDMKGFIAATLAMAEDYAALDLTRPVHFAFTHDEETGCIGAQALVEELKAQGLKPAIAIIGEPTEMRIIEGHKGCCEYTTRFTGLEGHGSQPARGVNAAEYAVRYVTKLMELRHDLMARAPKAAALSRPTPPSTSAASLAAWPIMSSSAKPKSNGSSAPFRTAITHSFTQSSTPIQTMFCSLPCARCIQQHISKSRPWGRSPA